MNSKSDEFIANLPVYMDRYIDVCLTNTKQVATGSGKIVEINDRHIPTIEFFLRIWLPKNLGETISPSTYYEWLKSQDPTKSETIKSIDDKFKALAGDIVANEGKGIFYAKNKLGWTDKQDMTTGGDKISNVTVTVIKSDAPLASSEGEISLD